MKNILCFLLLFLSGSIIAQSETASDSRKLSYGLYFSSAIGYRTLNTEPVEVWLKEQRDAEEKSAFGYRFGAKTDYRFSERIRGQVGLIFADRVYKTIENSLNFNNLPDDAITSNYLSFHYKYLDIPLKVSYDFASQKRLNFFVASGITTSIFLSFSKNNHTQTSTGWTITKDNKGIGYDRLNFFAVLEPGIAYKLSSMLSIRASLNMEYGLKATNVNLLTQERLFAGGMELGFTFTPNKK